MMKNKNNFILDGWQYNCNFVDSHFEFEVISPTKTDIPKNLYKFYDLSKNSIDALTNLYIYASHPNQFNDRFDCYEKVVEFDNISDVKCLWSNLYDKFCNSYTGEKTQFLESIKAFRTLFYRKCGILCLTPNKDSEQMWALYSKNVGFRLGFNINQFPFHHYGPFPIHYIEQLPKIKTSQCGIHTAALIQTNVKHKSWEYENEWRLLISNPDGFDMKSFGLNADCINRPDDHDRKFHYPLSALADVTLGIDFFTDAQLESRLYAHNSEMTVIYPKICLQTMLLDFLSEIQKKYFLKVHIILMKEDSYGIEEIPVLVIKLNKYAYHFIETK